MNKENARKIGKMIQEAGNYLLCQRDSLVHIGWHWFTVVMRTIYNSLKINRIKRH